MDGKIIQEVEGIVNGSGFVKMAESQEFVGTGSNHKIVVDFIPKVILVSSPSGYSGLAIKPCTEVASEGYLMLHSIVWSENSVTFSTNNLTYIVAVLG